MKRIFTALTFLILLAGNFKAHAQNAGSLDSSFGVNGQASSPFFDAEYNYASAIQPDGKIVLAGCRGKHSF